MTDTHPLADPAVVDALGADLRAAGYGIDAVFALLGAPVAAALRRGLRWPALRATADDPAPLATIVRLFELGAAEPADRIENAFPATGLPALLSSGVLSAQADGSYCAALDIRPHTGAEPDFLVVADPDAVWARAEKLGATVVREMRDEDYGSRGFSIADPEGNKWSFGTYAG